jgi:hypothetical protein
MILRVNGIRLVGQRSGVARAIEAILHCMAEMDHPFGEIRVYSPKPIAKEVLLPPCATNVVLSTSLPNALWEQFALLKAHGNKDLLLGPSHCPTSLIHHGSYEGYPQSCSWWTLNKARLAYSLGANRRGCPSTPQRRSSHAKGSHSGCACRCRLAGANVAGGPPTSCGVRLTPGETRRDLDLMLPLVDSRKAV